MSRKDIRQWVQLARDLGWVVRRTGSGHLQWLSPSGAVVITSSHSVTEGRGVKNDRAHLRKAGLPI